MRLIDFPGPKSLPQPALIARVPTDAGPQSRIGEMLVQGGALHRDDIPRILDYQGRRRVRFGEAAIKLLRVKPTDVEAALAQQHAYSYPQPDEFAPELIAAYQPASRAVEALREHRNLLLQHRFDAGPKALAIVSADANDGRSFLAANLAVLFAQLGRDTLLIDADLRRPRQHQIFRLENDCGLSTVLSGHSRNERIYRYSNLANLAVLPAGPLSPNPLELLSRDRFSGLLQALVRRFQVVLVDTPVGSAHPDAQMIASRCGAALLVTRAKRTRLTQAHHLVQRLTRAKIQVVGAVLNRH